MSCESGIAKGDVYLGKIVTLVDVSNRAAVTFHINSHGMTRWFVVAIGDPRQAWEACSLVLSNGNSGLLYLSPAWLSAQSPPVAALPSDPKIPYGD